MRFPKTTALVSAVVLATTLGACASTRSTGDQIDDAAITASVKAKLAADPEVAAHEIDVDTIDGEVRLSGIVDDATARNEAGELARRTDGVRSVRNDLRVGHDPSTGTEIDDAGITASVKAALVGDDMVRARDIDVDTLEGVVTLSGIVRSQAERQRAEELAEETSGVRSVSNLLEVRADPS